MAWRRRLAVVFLVAIVAVVSIATQRIRTAEAFDRGFVAIVTEIQKRMVKAMGEKDTLPDLYAHLGGAARDQVKALPESGQAFQEGLRQRLDGFLVKAAELNKLDPLTAGSNDTLNNLYLELQDMLQAQAEGLVFTTPY